jgi:hypothetical protein
LVRALIHAQYVHRARGHADTAAGALLPVELSYGHGGSPEEIIVSLDNVAENEGKEK